MFPRRDHAESGFVSEPDANAQLWETHADWWQREFTDGVDPEYTEQIIPLILEWTEGFERVLEVGTGGSQVAQAIASTHGATGMGIDPASHQIDEAIRRGGGPEYQLAGARSASVRRRVIRRSRVLSGVRTHWRSRRSARRGRARVLRPGGRFIFYLTTHIAADARFRVD